jgi:hypothetical protein
MADEFAVFDASGKLQGNLTSSFGQAPVAGSPQGFQIGDLAKGNPGGGSPGNDWSTIPDYLGSLPSSFAPSSTSSGPVITSSGGTSGGAFASSTGSASTQPSNAQAGAVAPASASGVASGSIADYFLRGVIIVLGFIFVAIGLNMFRPGVVPDPRRLVR